MIIKSVDNELLSTNDRPKAKQVCENGYLLHLRDVDLPRRVGRTSDHVT
jgi:hypothetical protein